MTTLGLVLVALLVAFHNRIMRFILARNAILQDARSHEQRRVLPIADDDTKPLHVQLREECKRNDAFFARIEGRVHAVRCGDGEVSILPVPR